MVEENALILEITCQNDLLKMSISSNNDTVSTLKQYSQHKVNFIEIEKLCQEITSALNKVNLRGPEIIKVLQKAGQALWDHLLSRSVKERLKLAYGVNLLLMVDEELIVIPWELLFDGLNFLCLNFNLGRLVRTKSQAAQVAYRSPGHVLKMLILANPTNDLKCAYLEGLNIKNQFDRKHSSVQINFKSMNADKLYVKKNLCDYDIVHFCGHCEFDQHNPKNGGWVLNDGKFTTHDILAMAQTSSLPALIFSNACQSAQGLGQTGLIEKDYQKRGYSLASAFLFSGVRHYIGAIRRIEDTAGLIFAKEFYHCLISGKPVGESVRLSRVRLVKEYGLTNLHWANYLLYGDPSFTLFKPKAKPIKPRDKVSLKRRKKLLLLIAFLAGVLPVLFLLRIWLPTVNPDAYRLFLKSQNSFTRGDNNEALRLGNLVMEKDPNFLDNYILLADTYHRLGNKDSAIKYYFDYVLLAEKKRDSKRMANGYIKIGWFYHLDGEYVKAYDFYNKAIKLAQENKDRLNEAIALRKLAVWHIDKKEYDLALQLLTKSSEINRERQYINEHRYNLACDYFDLGLVFANKEDFNAADEFYRKSRIIFEKLKFKHELSDYYFNLGELSFYEKKYQKALEYYLLGLKVDQAQGNILNLPSDYNMIGELYMEMSRFIEAEAAFKQAGEIAEKIQSKPDLAASNHNLGLLYGKLARKSKAKEHLRVAQEIYSNFDPLAYKEVKDEILSLDKAN